MSTNHQEGGEPSSQPTTGDLAWNAVLAPRLPLDPELTALKLDRLVFDQGFPLSTEERTTFAYRGPVDSVRLIHFGIGLPSDLGFERLEGSDWWLLVLDLPHGTRLEYQIEVNRSDGSETIRDPLNPNEYRNPFGSNSVCRSFGYSVPPWALHDAEAQPGSLRSLTIPSEALGRPVQVSLYLPSTFTPDPEHKFPLVIMHDGSDYLHYAEATTVLDNLIHRGLAPELVVAFCDPGDRLVEYPNHEPHARFIAEELVPYLESHLPLIGEPNGRCLGGASFGALATLSTANRYPDTFGHLLLQSGSFAGASAERSEPDEPLWRPVTKFVSDYMADPKPVADRVFMSCGLLEPMIAENRAIRPVLKGTGMQVVAAETLDGHTWGCWRDVLGVALTWLFADHFRPRDVQPFEPDVESATLATNREETDG